MGTKNWIPQDNLQLYKARRKLLLAKSNSVKVSKKVFHILNKNIYSTSKTFSAFVTNWSTGRLPPTTSKGKPLSPIKYVAGMQTRGSTYLRWQVKASFTLHQKSIFASSNMIKIFLGSACEYQQLT